MLSHLPIEQYRSIAWFNVACGVVLLLLFVILFRGESSWKDVIAASTSSVSVRVLGVHLKALV